MTNAPMLRASAIMTGSYWAVVLAYGLATTALGVTLAVWPGETLVVLAVVVGIELIITGIFRVIGAITATSMDVGVRAVLGFVGGLAVVVGLLCLRDPVQTILVLGTLLGVWWVASGCVEIVSAVLSPASAERFWNLALGVISVAAGGFLLIYTALSLGIFVLVASIWLIGTGVVSVFAALTMRAKREPAPAPTGAAQPTA